MSSWERSRYIPWSRLNEVSGGNFETEKERVYRSLNRDLSKENEGGNKGKEVKQQIKSGDDDSSFVPPEVRHDSSAQQQRKKTGIFRGVDYTTPDLLRNAAFGGCIGSITGVTFGFMWVWIFVVIRNIFRVSYILFVVHWFHLLIFIHYDFSWLNRDGMRTASDSTVLRNASNASKLRFLARGSTSSGMTFGAAFGLFHVLKYGTRVVIDEPGNVIEIATASVLTVGGAAFRTATRGSVPYLMMLIGMDSFSIYMREELWRNKERRWVGGNRMEKGRMNVEKYNYFDWKDKIVVIS